MQRRSITDTINEDATLQRLGVLANLLFDRLLSITDEAGLVAGEPRVVWGRVCAELPGVELSHVESAINKLVDAGFLYRRDWNGRTVLCFKPEAFQRIQGFRKDYRRKFSFGVLSQLVWEQGLHGFRTVVPQGTSESGASVTVSVTGTVTTSTADSGESSGSEKSEAKSRSKTRRLKPKEVVIPDDLKPQAGPIIDWLLYKQERGEGYTPRGLASLWAIVRRLGSSLAQTVEASKANNYSGLFASKGGNAPSGRQFESATADDYTGRK